MNRPGWWIALVAAIGVMLACDPNKTPKPGEPPKPVAQLVKPPPLDDLTR
ncbi:hypothetical protein LRS03_01685 [Rhizobacter sp. J219]|jgi:hypothetical protein|nr:hypothetical protein [Rhizobacter sp. J219]MCR5881642.1 hypothetical protein [Rhizobacter sp. J219]